MCRVVHLNCASLSGMYKIDHNMAPPFARQGLVARAGLPVTAKCQTVSWYMTGAFSHPSYTSRMLASYSDGATRICCCLLLLLLLQHVLYQVSVLSCLTDPEATPRLPGALP